MNPTNPNLHAPALSIQAARTDRDAAQRALDEHDMLMGSDALGPQKGFEAMKEHARLLRSLAYAEAEHTYALMIAHAITSERARRRNGPEEAGGL